MKLSIGCHNKRSCSLLFSNPCATVILAVFCQEVERHKEIHILIFLVVSGIYLKNITQTISEHLRRCTYKNNISPSEIISTHCGWGRLLDLLSYLHIKKFVWVCHYETMHNNNTANKGSLKVIWDPQKHVLPAGRVRIWISGGTFKIKCNFKTDQTWIPIHLV